MSDAVGQVGIRVGWGSNSTSCDVGVSKVDGIRGFLSAEVEQASRVWAGHIDPFIEVDGGHNSVHTVVVQVEFVDEVADSLTELEGIDARQAVFVDVVCDEVLCLVSAKDEVINEVHELASLLERHNVVGLIGVGSVENRMECHPGLVLDANNIGLDG